MSQASEDGTLSRMSLDSSLLIRRWPERRPVVLAAAALTFAAVAAAVVAAGDPALGVLSVLPVMLAALELGLVGGLVAAAGATALVLADGAVLPAVAPLAVAAVAGRFSDRMRAVHARGQRLLDSALALGEPGAYHRLPGIVATAAVRTPRATGAAVELEGIGSAVAGRMKGRRTSTPIAARRALLGRIEMAPSAGALDPEDRRRPGAAGPPGRARRRRPAPAQQRCGLGHLLDAQEDDRRRLAETLHEEPAQVLAAVLMRLRMLRRHGADAARSTSCTTRSWASSRTSATSRRPCGRRRWRSWASSPRSKRATAWPLRWRAAQAPARAPAHRHLPVRRARGVSRRPG